MSRAARSFDAPHDPTPPRLPFIGGPFGHNHPDRLGHPQPCVNITCPDAKTRPADKATHSRKDWTGEYRRTTTCWQWTPPVGKSNPVTDIVHRMGLVTHPTPSVIADAAETVAKRVRRDGTQTIRQASVLAARGLRAATGGIAASDPTTPVERAVGLAGDGNDNDPPFNLTPADRDLHGIDAELARLHRQWWAIGDQLEALYDRIQSHATDDDPIPAGTGSCRRCNQFWRPTADKPEDRIKSGYGAPCCYMKWVRAGRPDKTLFDRTPDDNLATVFPPVNDVA